MSPPCRTIHHCLCIELTFIDVLSVEKPQHWTFSITIVFQWRIYRNNVAKWWQNRNLIHDILHHLFRTRSYAKFTWVHLEINFRNLIFGVAWLQRVITWFQRVNFVVRMLHHIAVPLGETVNVWDKVDLWLSYAKIFPYRVNA